MKRLLGLERLEPRCMLSSSAAIAPAAEGLDIVLQLGPNLAADPVASAAIERAAQFWESVLFDPIVVHIDVELTDQGFTSTRELAEARPQSVTYFYHDVRDRLIADASMDDSLVRSLPEANGQLQFDLAPGIDVRDPVGDDPVIRLARANALALGFRDIQAVQSLFEPGVTIDAYLKFNSTARFDFDLADGVTSGSTDFEGVAIHEMGHALGLNSSVDSIDALVSQGTGGAVDPTVMDLFRLAAGQGASFSTAPRILNTGNNVPVQVFHDGRLDVTSLQSVIPTLQTGDVPLSTGVQEGDGRQAGHIKDNAFTNVELGIMDPILPRGRPAEVTATDLRLLSLIGWDWHDTDAYGAPPRVAITTLETTDPLAALAGTVSEPDAQVLVRLPQTMGTNRVTLTVDGNPADRAFTLMNHAESDSRIARTEIVLPGAGGGVGRVAATPIFNPIPALDFQADPADAATVGLVSPESDALNDEDVLGFSKTLTLVFNTFDPGDSITWSIDVGDGDVLGNELAGALVIVEFENGMRTQGTLTTIPDQTDASQVTLESEHAIRADNPGDGTWSLPAGALAPLEIGAHPIEVFAIDTSGAWTLASENTLTVRSAWQNPLNPLDIDGDGVILPLDVLQIINDINLNGNRVLPALAPPTTEPPPFLDPTGDGFVEPVDALMIINFINDQGPAGFTALGAVPTNTARESTDELDDHDLQPDNSTTIPWPVAVDRVWDEAERGERPDNGEAAHGDDPSTPHAPPPASLLPQSLDSINPSHLN